jgi:hypothetical protein
VDGGGDETKVVSLLHPYMVEVYVAREESEACLSPDPLKAFCTQVGAVKEVRLELAFSRYETYEDKTREVHRQKGLLTFALRRKNT